MNFFFWKTNNQNNIDLKNYSDNSNDLENYKNQNIDHYQDQNQNEQQTNNYFHKLIKNIYFFIFNNKIFVGFFFSYSILVWGLFYYFNYELQQNSSKFTKTTINSLESTFIRNNRNVFDSIERSLFTQKSVFDLLNGNLTQTDFFSFTRSDLDPFSDVYNNFRYSPLVYRENRKEYNSFGKSFINPNFKIKPSTINIDNTFINQDFYIPISYIDPDVFFGTDFSKIAYGFDLNNFTDTSINFFNHFYNLKNKVVGLNINFGLSIDKYDTGLYIGILNFREENCVQFEHDNFHDLMLINHTNNTCVLGFDYIAIIMREYVDSILSSINVLSDRNLHPENIDYVVINENTNKVIARSKSLINTNINKLQNIEKFSNEYFRKIKITNFFKFNTGSIGDIATIYLLFEEDEVISEEINTQITTLISTVVILYFTFSIIFFYAYYLYLKNLYLYSQNISLYKDNINILEEKYIEIKKFMTYVNHELRNPLNIVYGSSQNTEKEILRTIKFIVEDEYSRDTDGNFILKRKSDEEVLNIDRKHLKIKKNIPHDLYFSLLEIHSNIMTINNSTRFASVIINDVLDLQRLEDDGLNITNSWFSSTKLFVKFYKSLIHKIYEVKSIVKTLIYIDKQILFYSDIDRVIQIIVNLYTNSVKHTFQGNITIICKYKNNGEKILLCVSDSGEGIQQDIKKDIFFKPFTKQKKSSNSIGIGLYISKLITNALNIELSYKSLLNVGSVFYIEFDVSNFPPKNNDDIDQALCDHLLINDEISSNITFINSEEFDETKFISVLSTYNIDNSCEQKNDDILGNDNFNKNTLFDNNF